MYARHLDARHRSDRDALQRVFDREAVVSLMNNQLQVQNVDSPVGVVEQPQCKYVRRLVWAQRHHHWEAVLVRLRLHGDM